MSDQRRNRLGEEKSPYLQQHRSNPVWWQPWGREAFDTARELDLPVFLSVGYSTCHWCHVMERESFEDEGVAEVLNRGFVSIKVDREERPDVDALYMDAVHAFGQRGGWPMSVWMTPEAKPFAAGTYFPREHFVGILQNITEAWRGGQRQQIEEQGRALIDALVNSRARERAGGLDESLLVDFLGEWTRAFDPRHGGRQGAPKFPPAWDLQLLMRVARRLVDPAGREKALEIVRVTLDRMAASGTYDQLGGGFHRYSTDERWLVPHFEKMLYDQASLTLAYVDAWQLTGDEEYALVARETCDYVLRDMTHPNGGFYSAEDADSEGEEGLFYVWHEDELKRLLREEELARLEEEFTISAGGNFERGANILAAREGRTRKARPPELKVIMTRLFEHRATRPRPHLDDKILTDWNGLMITAMARAGRALREPRYVEGAKSAARFVLERLVDDEGRLMHRWREDEAAIAGTLDDHAFLVEALIELYQATFDTSFIERALELDERMHALFAEEGTGDLHLTDGSDEVLPMRRVELFDNVVPAGRSVAAHNALRLAELSGDAARAERAQAIFAATPALASQHPGAFARLLAALDHALDRAKAVALIGPPGAARDAMLAALEEGYHPNRLVALGEKGREPGALGLLEGREAGDGEVLAHVCEEGICQLPTDDPAKAAELAAAHEPLPSPGR